MYCAQCGVALPDGSRSCPACGFLVLSPRRRLPAVAWVAILAVAVVAGASGLLLAVPDLGELSIAGQALPVNVDSVAPNAPAPESRDPSSELDADFPAIFSRVSSGVVPVTVVACDRGGTGTSFLIDSRTLVLPRSRELDGHRAIIDWYTRCGTSWLRPHVKEWANRLRVDPGPLEVADLGHKWGAATANGRVRIHWATMQLRPPLVDYVLAHELAHLREPHHGPAFWRLLARVMPDYDERRTELARVGARLWLGVGHAT